MSATSSSDAARVPAEGRPWTDPARPVGERVELLLAAMTLEEKLAQLGSFWPRDRRDQADDFGDTAPLEHEVSGARTDFEAAARHGLGHVTRAFGSTPVTPTAGLEGMRRMQRFLVERTRLGVPAIVHEESLTGFTTLGATVYPVPPAWGATFSPDLVRRMAAAIGADLRRVGAHQSLSPLLDVVRDYRWGRVEECIGEDPYLVGTLGSAYVQGLEQEGVVATLKHYAGYSASRAGRNHAPVPIGRRELNDVILPPFEMAVREGGTRSVMNSYSDVDGEPAATSRYLLTEVLRDRWGFQGTVVSDYWAITFVHTMHKVAQDLAHAGAAALRAGIDVELPETQAYAAVASLVESGELGVDVVDTAVRRVLRQKVELGLLDEGWEPTDVDGATVDLDPPGNRAIARELAEQSVVLLANRSGVLPLAPSGTVALVGPTAGEVRTLFGCYSFPNHVLSRFGETDLGLPVTSLADAIVAELPGVRVRQAAGAQIMSDDITGIPEAVALARAADVAVVTVGDISGIFGFGTSGEGCDAPDLRLPGSQHALVEAVLGTGTPTVLVVVSGRPYALGAYAERAAAIVQAFLPGVEGAGAVAGVLSGRVNPSGHLPLGIPRGPGGQPGTYLAPILGRFSRGVTTQDPSPLFPFGHGESYTTFAYDDLTLDAARIPADGTLQVAVTVRNAGARAGQDVVQLYLSDDYAQVTRPERWLAGVARVSLEPGAAARVRFTLHADVTSFTGVDHVRIVEPGTFTVAVGHSSEELPLTSSFAITGDVRPVGDRRVLSVPVAVEPIG